MNIVITKPINPKASFQQHWTFPEGAPRFLRGLSPDGTTAFIEVDPDNAPGTPCVVQVGDISKPVIGGVVGVFKQGNKWKVASTTCFA
jgi:hypothetical protein